MKPSGESGACDVGGERGWTSRLQPSLGRRAVCSAGMWETPGMRPRVGVSAIVGYSCALQGGRAGGILYVAGMPWHRVSNFGALLGIVERARRWHFACCRHAMASCEHVPLGWCRICREGAVPWVPPPRSTAPSSSAFSFFIFVPVFSSTCKLQKMTLKKLKKFEQPMRA